MSLLPHLRSVLRGLALPSPARVVVAVSGGPDSLCLLHALHALRAELGLELRVAHLDHAFRGDESAEEAAFVADFARQLGLPATIVRRDVPALVARHGLNAQAAARAMRYAFLAEVALAHQAHAVAVAHHADDQAETVLMHLLRGAGPAGLRGMRPVVAWGEWANQMQKAELRIEKGTPQDSEANNEIDAPSIASDNALSQFSILNSQFPLLIRPLLAIRRAQIEAYCAAQGLEPRRDPSNTSPRYMRSRVRAALLPQLAEYNQHVVEQLGHTAAICADDYDYMQQQLDSCWPALITAQGDDYVDFDGGQWRVLHPALQRYAVRRAALLIGGDELSFAQVEATRHIALLPVGARCELPGGALLVVGYNGFALRRSAPGAASDQPQLRAPELPVAAPGTTQIGNGWWLEAFTSAPAGWANDAWCATLDADALSGPLVLRARQRGDRMRLAGGTRSLQNMFVDQKLPRALRDRWPLLVSPVGIAWAIGLRVDTRFSADQHSAHRLWVRCTNVG